MNTIERLVNVTQRLLNLVQEEYNKNTGITAEMLDDAISHLALVIDDLEDAKAVRSDKDAEENSDGK